MNEVNVLVVVDTQVDFESGSLGTAEAKATVPDIVRKIVECGNHGYTIVNTMDTHNEDYLETHEGRLLPIEHTVINTAGWQVVPGICQVLDQYGAFAVLKDRFGWLALPDIIRSLTSRKSGGILPDGRNLNITLIGWCTDVCVISNALILRAGFPEAEITVDSKCCAGVTPEAHQAALTVMNSCQINVV